MRASCTLLHTRSRLSYRLSYIVASNMTPTRRWACVRWCRVSCGYEVRGGWLEYVTVGRLDRSRRSDPVMRSMAPEAEEPHQSACGSATSGSA
jgi:hypothetical protein